MSVADIKQLQRKKSEMFENILKRNFHGRLQNSETFLIFDIICPLQIRNFRF